MLTKEGFDRWAGEYDGSVSASEEESSYPFAGYQRVLSAIEEAVTVSGSCGASVLDLGLGTASLTSRLYREGFQIYGLDFSKEMLSLAREKMPAAELFQGDFALGLPKALEGRFFDFIIGTYSFHHVPPARREEFFSGLAEHLKKDGRIFVGDLVFPSSREYEACRQRFSGIWDQDEIYFTADELAQQLRGLNLVCTFQPVSFCAGILAIRRRETAKE